MLAFGLVVVVVFFLRAFGEAVVLVVVVVTVVVVLRGALWPVAWRVRAMKDCCFYAESKRAWKGESVGFWNLGALDKQYI